MSSPFRDAACPQDTMYALVSQPLIAAQVCWLKNSVGNDTPNSCRNYRVLHPTAKGPYCALVTEWGAKITTTDTPLPEYPRPQLVRLLRSPATHARPVLLAYRLDGYLILFRFAEQMQRGKISTACGSSSRPCRASRPLSTRRSTPPSSCPSPWRLHILSWEFSAHFLLSSELVSCVCPSLSKTAPDVQACLSGVWQNHAYLWYRQVFPTPWLQHRTILHFGAVDWQVCEHPSGQLSVPLTPICADPDDIFLMRNRQQSMSMAGLWATTRAAMTASRWTSRPS